MYARHISGRMPKPARLLINSTWVFLPILSILAASMRRNSQTSRVSVAALHVVNDFSPTTLRSCLSFGLQCEKVQ